MNHKEAVALLRQITYKPNWQIQVMSRYDMFMDIEIVLRTKGLDPKTGELIDLASRTIIPWSDIDNARDPEAMLLDIMFRFIKNSEVHEAKEWFRLDGKQVYPTH